MAAIAWTPHEAFRILGRIDRPVIGIFGFHALDDFLRPCIIFGKVAIRDEEGTFRADVEILDKTIGDFHGSPSLA